MVFGTLAGQTQPPSANICLCFTTDLRIYHHSRPNLHNLPVFIVELKLGTSNTFRFTAIPYQPPVLRRTF